MSFWNKLFGIKKSSKRPDETYSPEFEAYRQAILGREVSRMQERWRTRLSDVEKESIKLLSILDEKSSSAITCVEADGLLNDLPMGLAGWEEVNLSACLIDYALQHGLDRSMNFDAIRERAKGKYSATKEKRAVVLKALEMLLVEYNKPDTHTPNKSIVEKAKTALDTVSDPPPLVKIGESPKANNLRGVVERGDLETVKAILKEDPNLAFIEDDAAWTLLHVASFKGYKDVARILLDYGAKVDAKEADSDGTPLDMAALKRREDVVELLLAHNADVNAKKKNGFTPLHTAAFRGHKGIVELLLNHGAQVNDKENDGYTPLHIAVREGRKEVVELLMTYNADINARADGGVTPLRVATVTGNDIIAELLRQHGGHDDSKP